MDHKEKKRLKSIREKNYSDVLHELKQNNLFKLMTDIKTKTVNFSTSYKPILFIFIYTLLTMSVVVFIPIIEHLRATNLNMKILLETGYYFAYIPLVILTFLSGLIIFAKGEIIKGDKSRKKIFLLMLFILFLFRMIYYLKWNIISNNPIGFYKFSMVLTIPISFFIVNKIYNLLKWVKIGYASSLKNGNALDAQSKIINIIISISITSIASLFAIIASLYKFGVYIYQIMKF